MAASLQLARRKLCWRTSLIELVLGGKLCKCKIPFGGGGGEGGGWIAARICHKYVTERWLVNVLLAWSGTQQVWSMWNTSHFQLLVENAVPLLPVPTSLFHTKTLPLENVAAFNLTSVYVYVCVCVCVYAMW